MIDSTVPAHATRPTQLHRRVIAAHALRGSGRRSLLLFAGLLFAGKLGDGPRWLEAWVAFAAYSLTSNGALSPRAALKFIFQRSISYDHV